MARGTDAMYMFLDRIDAKTIAEQRGHSDVVLTVQMYGHVTPIMHRDAAQRHERLHGWSENHFSIASEDAPTQ
jgi:integrase